VVIVVGLGGVSLISFGVQTQDLFLLESGMYHLKLFVIASIQIEEVQAEEVLNREKEIREVVIEGMVVHKTLKSYVAV